MHTDGDKGKYKTARLFREAGHNNRMTKCIYKRKGREESSGNYGKEFCLSAVAQCVHKKHWW